MSDRLLYVPEVAEMIRRSEASLRYMIHTGNAPRSAKIGGRVMFRESDVLAWIEEQFAEVPA
ncbi:helix-turn-helix transcriptional regulator [Brevibacterium litoralis]|uniref:helix-turn-helix transcriptional regulator n=1 Tax=Brevibacterium litoralis TaxID=3138935 RepID=UPI0032EB0F25